MVRCAGWEEMIFLLFGDVVFLRLWVDVFDFFVAVHGRHTPPAPLERGGRGAAFCLKIRRLIEGRLWGLFFL